MTVACRIAGGGGGAIYANECVLTFDDKIDKQ
jgi:hypothetical protein